MLLHLILQRLFVLLFQLVVYLLLPSLLLFLLRFELFQLFIVNLLVSTLNRLCLCKPLLVELFSLLNLLLDYLLLPLLPELSSYLLLSLMLLYLQLNLLLLLLLLPCIALGQAKKKKKAPRN